MKDETKHSLERWIAKTSIEGHAIVSTRRHHQVADCGESNLGNDANARLIAKAYLLPELVEALREIANRFDEERAHRDLDADHAFSEICYHCHSRRMIESARAALAAYDAQD